LTWWPKFLALVALTAALLVGGGAALAQETEQPELTSFSQFLRANGYTVSDPEAQYLDADEQFQLTYAQGLWNVHLLSLVEPEQRNDEWRQTLVTELNRLLAADPSAAPQAPASLQRHRELGMAQRSQVREAARQWLAAVQAGDPEWLERGGDAYRAALQGLENWQQELLVRFPPPQAQP
jgi:hypothetical protein